MKVRISYTVDANDELRRAISDHYGRPGLATREEIKAWYESNGVSSDPDLYESLPDDGQDAVRWDTPRESYSTSPEIEAVRVEPTP